MKSIKILIIACMLLPVFQVIGDTKIVNGEMSFEFTLKSNNEELLSDFFEYENNSNLQKVVERGEDYIVVRTVAKLGDLHTDVSFPVDSLYEASEFKEYLDYSTSRKGIEITRGNGQTIKREFVEKTPMTNKEIDLLERTARSVTADTSRQYEAVEAVMRYIRENVSYTLRSSSNPADVLRTGKAYCEGYANVAALMLRVLGIPTKVVDSYIPPGHMWGYGQEGSGGYHAHVEVYYKDAGWVSYDPQATVHFVDPFHIVNFPRERTSLQQGTSYDGRNIIDILQYPGDTNNFFQRNTSDSRASAVFVGRIYRSDGSVVKDSFRTGEWVYLRRENGTASGIRILSNGQFALVADKKHRIFYRDGQGGWYEEQIEVSGSKRVYKEIRLDRKEELIHIDLDGNSQLFSWYKSPDTRWMLEKIGAGSQGEVRILSDTLKGVISTEKSPLAIKYLLHAAELKEGERYLIDELPRYFDPDTPYLDVKVDAEYSLKFIELSSGRTYQGPDVTEVSGVVPVPDDNFSTIVLQNKGIILLTSLPELTNGTAVPVNIEENAVKFTIEAGRANYPVHITVKRGRRYASLVSGVTDTSGRVELYFQPSLLNDEAHNFILLHGNPIQRRRIPLKDVEQEIITLE